jgi:glutathione S-transferase
VYTVYVIPGSHACRSAILMLEHKRVPFRTVKFVTLLHPLAARLHGFDARGEKRSAGGRQTLGLRIGDKLGTVPGLAAGRERISTNYGIARFLEQRHPEPHLFPADPNRREAVEEAERWANGTLQMAARRILGAEALHHPERLTDAAADGRLGYLLYRHARVRRRLVPLIVRQVFATPKRAEHDPIGELPGMLDRIDAWIADGVLGAEQPNVADFMVAPSLALTLYRPDAKPLFEGRPALDLVDRLLPEPDVPVG